MPVPQYLISCTMPLSVEGRERKCSREEQKKMFTAFLIKYAEIGVKGKNRYLFEEALVQQIKYAVKDRKSVV